MRVRLDLNRTRFASAMDCLITAESLVRLSVQFSAAKIAEAKKVAPAKVKEVGGWLTNGHNEPRLKVVWRNHNTGNAGCQ